ncbi:MAG: hypothetical protein R3C05_27550 [Pirellulaceae bacterium]
MWFDVNRITPDGIIAFAWGTQPGTTFLPQYGVTLGIANAKLSALAEGDIDGTTSGLFRFPSFLPVNVICFKPSKSPHNRNPQTCYR